MPFTPATLGALIQSNDFTLWHYRTPDLRTAVGGAGYFPTEATSLRPGDLMLLQAADMMALVPVRSGPTLGPGVAIDTFAAPLHAVRTATQSFSITQTAAAVVRTLILAPIAAIIAAGSVVPVSAQVVGPIAEVRFVLRDGAGNFVPPVRTVTVAAGRAEATFPPPPNGTGYSVTVADAAEPGLAVTGNAFNVGTVVFPPAVEPGVGDLVRVLLETGGLLLAEDGAALAA